MDEAKKEVGLDISGYRHSADMFAVRHAINKHSDVKAELNRGNVAITQNDIAAVPDVVTNPDTVVYGIKNRRKQDLISSIKKMPDGSLLVIEEVRTGRKILAMESMRKYPAARFAGSIVRTLLSNGLSIGGAGVKIVHRTPEVKGNVRWNARPWRITIRIPAGMNVRLNIKDAA